MSNRIIIYFFFILLITYQFILFFHFTHTDVIHFYPPNFDQQSYLMDIYAIVAAIEKNGFWQGLLNSPVLATGVLFPIQTVLFFTLTGASRFHALLLNFTYFAGLQWAVFSVSKKIFNRFSIGFIFLGLLLMIKVPFTIPGGIMDYRIDFMTFCLYGIFIALIIRSDIFLDRRWTLLAVIGALVLTLTRIITATYLMGIIFTFFCYFIFLYYKQKESIDLRTQTIKRIKNLLLFSSILAIIAIPIIWLNREALYNYYVIGHILGKEKIIRAALSGTTIWWKNLLYYPATLVIYNTGWATIFYAIFWLCAALLVVKKFVVSQQKSTTTFFSPALIFLSLSIVIPLMILTSDTQKSAVVASLLLTPIIWIFIFLFMHIIRDLNASTKNKLCVVVATLTLAIGIWHQHKAYQPKLTHQEKIALNNLTTMYVNIGDYAIENHWKNIRLSVDQIDDRLTSGDLVVLYFEKCHRLLPVIMEPLGGSIFAITQPAALRSLHNSNVAIFDLNHNPGNKNFPLNASVDKFKPILLSYVYQHFHLLKKYAVDHQLLAVFVK